MNWIKKSIGIFINKSKEKVKSILTGKIRGSRIGKSDWNPITIEKIKTNKYLNKYKAELNLKDSIHLSKIIDEFKNVNNIGIDTFKHK